MRALRMTLAGTVILALLGGLGSAVAAQTEDEPASAAITAGAPGGDIVEPGTIEFGEGVIQYRDVIQTGTIEDPSDPRFSGTWTWTSNRDQHSGTTSFDITSGFFRVENELGAWQGLPTVWLDYGGGFTRPATVVFTGEGAYEGWTIVAEFNTLGGWGFDGVIYEGDVPPSPEAPTE